nr:extracellular solute-binding protein [Cohnella lubricantis]
MFSGENYFYQEYGRLFMGRYPNIDVEVADTQSLHQPVGGVFSLKGYDEAVRTFIDEQQPDVLELSADQYAQFTAEGRLLNLEPVIKQDQFDTESIHPAVLQLLRDKGNGALYGLSPQFRSQALFYNADLFRQYGVEPPSDSMSWSELLLLAERFPTENEKGKRLYGFTFEGSSTLITIVYQIAMTENLLAVSPDGKTATVTSGAWKRVFEIAIGAFRSRAVNLADEPQPDAGTPATADNLSNENAFAAGRSAMTLDSSNLIQIIAQSQEVLTTDKPFDWHLVTEPVGSNDRTTGDSFSVDTVFAVNAHSANPRAAWEFIKYVSGEDYARAKSHALTAGQLLSRTDAIRDSEGRGYEAFYKLQSGPEKTLGLNKAPIEFNSSLFSLLNDELSQVASGAISLDEAMNAIQSGAQATLDEAWERDKLSKAESSNSPAASD